MTTKSKSEISPRLWILGAADPEMERIEALLRGCGEAVAHATAPGRDGGAARVTPAGAYAGATPSIPSGVETVVLVECECDGLRDGDDPPWRVVVVDHHWPGDPGYGRPPAEFLAASSIGQVVARLAAEGRLAGWGTGDPPVMATAYGPPGRIQAWRDAWDPAAQDWTGGPPRWVVCLAADRAGRTACAEVPANLVRAAAADHCLTAAYAGQCPGVEPARLAAWRDAVRASFQGRPLAAVQADREAAEAVLRAAPRLVLGDVEVADVRALGAVPELPEAAARLGMAVLYRLLPGDPGGDRGGRGGRVKVGILGAGEGTPAGTAPVDAFLGGWAAGQGLGGLYGNPARGFAGGYEAAP